MALYGPSLMQGLGGLAGAMGRGGNMVNGGWPGKQMSAEQAKLFGPGSYFGGLAGARKANPAQAALSMATAKNLPMVMRWLGVPSGTQYGTHTTANVVSPGQTQVVRPSQQPVTRRPSAPQAGAGSSMLTQEQTPGDIGLGMTSLLGG